MNIAEAGAIYCANSKCAVKILADKIEGTKAHCVACSHYTCKSCKGELIP